MRPTQTHALVWLRSTRPVAFACHRRARLVAIALAWTTLAVSAASAREWSVRDRSEIRRTFQLAAGARRIGVDNLTGPIEVVGEDRKDVQLVAVRITGARSEDALARANREVQLEIEAGKGGIDLYVDGPFRCGKDCVQDCSPRRDYSVRFEFSLRVPKKSDLDLRTVNDGDIVVRGVDGLQEVDNVNSGIEMSDIGGAVRADAVNGEVRVVFVSTPRDSCSFTSVNGDLDVTFPDNLSADVHVKTFNGEIYSAFEGELLPPRTTVVKEAHDGGTTYKVDQRGGLRVGRGGPAIEFDAFNGDVRIRRLER